MFLVINYDRARKTNVYSRICCRAHIHWIYSFTNYLFYMTDFMHKPPQRLDWAEEHNTREKWEDEIDSWRMFADSDLIDYDIIRIRDIKKFLHQQLQKAREEEREMCLEEFEQQMTWYNTNNQIPNSELSKGEEHWEMIRKVVRDSFQEVYKRTKDKIIHSELDQDKT